MDKGRCVFQIGKLGISENFILNLKTAFKNHRNIKINVLRSTGRTKEKMREYSEELLGELGNNYTARIVGFTIALKKWRKSKGE